MKFLLIALFLATIWLASSSASRLPRQLRVPLPLPTSSAPGERRKSNLFPKMNAKFVVTERAHKMAAAVKMAPMKRTNALLPNLNLKNKIMGDRNTKRMTSGPSGIATRPIVIRRFNLTKPSPAVPTTIRAPAAITKRPLARLPNTNVEIKVTKETPVLPTKRPITRPPSQILSDGKTKNVTDKHLKRSQPNPYTRDNENKTLEGTSTPIVRPPLRHYSQLKSSTKEKNSTTGDALILANKQHLIPNPSQVVDDVTKKTIDNVTVITNTTKRPLVTPAMNDISNEKKYSVKVQVQEVTTKGSSPKLDTNISEEQHLEETPLVRVKRL